MEKKKESVIVEEHNLPDARNISFSRNTTDIPEKHSSSMSQNMFVMLLVVFFISVFGLILYLKNTTGYKAASSKAEVPVSVNESLAQVTPQASASTTTVVAPASVDISSWKTFVDAKNSFTLQYPDEFIQSEPEKNYYVFSRGRDGASESFAVDMRMQGVYSNFTNAVASVKASFGDSQVDELPNGVRIARKKDPIDNYKEQIIIQYILHYKTGAVGISYSRHPAIIGESIVDQIFATFELTR